MKWLAAGLLAAALGGGAGATDEMRLTRRGPEQGLEVTSVTALLRDRVGLLWIGTRNGLALYDGNRTQRYEHALHDPNSLSDNTVRALLEDRAGNLWLGTTAGGLNRLDPARRRFTHYRHSSTDPASISHDSVNVILESRDGSLWVGTQIGLNRFDPATERFERFFTGDAPDGLRNDYIYALHEDAAGRLWVGTVGGGLHRWDGRAFEAWTPQGDHGLEDDRIFWITPDGEDTLWLASSDGLYHMDVPSERFTRYEPPGDTLVTCLGRANDGVLWVGTWRGGVSRFDTARRVFLPLAAAVDDDLSGRITSVLPDGPNRVWVGTWDGGLQQARPGATRVERLDTDDGLGFRDATAVAEDADGGLWVGTWGAGLSYRAAGATRFTEVPRADGEGLGTVLELHVAPDGAVWAGTMDGMYRVAGVPGAVREFHHDPADPQSLGLGYVNAIVHDRDGNLWVGVGGSGVHLLRPDGGFDRFVHRADDPASLSDDYVTAMWEDPRGTLWVGTRSGGLNALDRSSGRVRRYPAGGPGELSHYYVSAIDGHDADGFWVATAGGGLNLARHEDDGVSFRWFTERDGLLDNNVRAIAARPDGRLWLGTARGLNRFDPRDSVLVGFGGEDGLPAGGFNTGAAFDGRSEVFFGTSHGVLAIDHDQPAPRNEPSPTILRSIRTLDGPPTDGPAAWERPELETAFGETLTFEFGVLDYGNPREHRFAYRLAGRDPWIELGLRREITITGLAPGRYELAVRGRNSRGVWSEPEQPLRLIVVPPFWMTWWFRGAVVGAIALAGLGAHRLKTSGLKRRNRELLRLKEQRERALAEARASHAEREEAYDRLRRLTRRLELAKEDERRRIARELHDEMGQALTAAKINLQLLQADPGDAAAAERFTDTVGLVDRMIRHVRTLSLDLRPPLLDELGLDAALRGYAESQAQRSGLTIETDLALPVDLGADSSITVFRVVQETVTNVLRHAAATRIRVSIRAGESDLIGEVVDDGNGFEVEDTLERATAGSHLGLLGMRERVESLGGSLEIDSRPGHGTRIGFRVPF